MAQAMTQKGQAQTPTTEAERFEDPAVHLIEMPGFHGFAVLRDPWI